MRTLCPASLGNGTKLRAKRIKVTPHKERVIAFFIKNNSSRRKVIICPQVLKEPQHGGTYSSKRCSTHHDICVSHTFNRQTATKTTQVGDVFRRCRFILAGTRLWCHWPRGPIGLELFYTCLRNRSCKVSTNTACVVFPRRGTWI